MNDDRPRNPMYEIVKSEVLYGPPPDDLQLTDMFPRMNPYLNPGGGISHTYILWQGEREPTHLLGWWAPHALLQPDELAEAAYISDLDHLLEQRGVEQSAVLAKEDFIIHPPDEEERSLLELAPGERAMHVSSEYRDREGMPLLLKREIWISGGVGRIRDLAWERRYGGSYQFEW